MNVSPSKLTPNVHVAPPSDPGGPRPKPEGGQTLIGELWKARFWLAGGSTACALLAAGYAFTATPVYTATAYVLIESRANPVRARDPGTGLTPLEIPEVESQIELMQSEKIARIVVSALNADQISILQIPSHPAAAMFNSIRQWVTSMVEDPTPSEQGGVDNSATDALRQNLTARRVGPSYVIELAYTSTSRALSARVANDVAKAYVSDEVLSKSKLWKDATRWLDDRLIATRTKSNEATRWAQAYKAANQSNEGGKEGLIESRVKTRELEMSAEAYETIHRSMLQRYIEAVNQQSFPIPTTEIITTASQPKRPSAPKKLLLIALGAVFGLGLGVAAVSARMLRQSGVSA